MMREMTDGAMAWMMGGMGLVSILVLLVLVLGAAALLKYLFSTR
jgi:flagellar basal body-associated protein FliL